MSGYIVLNDPTRQNFGIIPRAGAVLNGQYLLRGLVSAEWTHNNYYEADTLHLTAVLSHQDPAYGLLWMGEQPYIYVDFKFSTDLEFPTFGSAVPVFYGKVDRVSVNVVKDTVDFHMRDLTSVFIDARISDSFTFTNVNDIVNTLALSAGFSVSNIFTDTANISAAVTSGIGKSFNVKNKSVWDVLTYLAQIQQPIFDVYVKGTGFYFKQRVAPTEEYKLVYTPTGPGGAANTGNFMDLEFSRNYTLARDIAVKVQSYNASTGQTVTGVAFTNFQALGGGGSVNQYIYNHSNVQEFIYPIPNLSLKQATAKAQSIAKEIYLHEMLVHCDTFGDMLLDPDQFVSLSGTQSVWDQRYFVNHARYNWHYKDGFTMGLELKNHSVQHQVAFT